MAYQVDGCEQKRIYSAGRVSPHVRK